MFAGETESGGEAVDGIDETREMSNHSAIVRAIFGQTIGFSAKSNTESEQQNHYEFMHTAEE